MDNQHKPSNQIAGSERYSKLIRPLVRSSNANIQVKKSVERSEVQLESPEKIARRGRTNDRKTTGDLKADVKNIWLKIHWNQHYLKVLVQWEVLCISNKILSESFVQQIITCSYGKDGQRLENCTRCKIIKQGDHNGHLPDP